MTRYHIYFHDDFDGMVSAVIFFDFFRKRGDKVGSFNPINYTPSIKKDWANFKFKKPFVLVDFMYHPNADWWFDHHETSFINPDWKKNYKDDDRHAFDQIYKSGCALVLAHLNKKYKYEAPKNIQELVYWGDIIDSAGYKNARQIVERKEPALRLMSYLDSLDKVDQKIYQAKQSAIIKNLATKSINNFIAYSLVSNRIKKYLSKTKKSVADFKKSAVIKGGVIFIDAINKEFPKPHFLAYYVYPKSFYSVSINKYGAYYHMSVGGNPWNKTHGTEINIGKKMRSYGGGGHKAIGGLEKKSKLEIMKIAEEIIEYLNIHG